MECGDAMPPACLHPSRVLERHAHCLPLSWPVGNQGSPFFVMRCIHRHSFGRCKDLDTIWRQQTTSRKTKTLTPVKQLPIRKFTDPTIFFLPSFFWVCFAFPKIQNALQYDSSIKAEFPPTHPPSGRSRASAQARN
jgi:hypothetical protein